MTSCNAGIDQYQQRRDVQHELEHANLHLD